MTDVLVLWWIVEIALSAAGVFGLVGTLAILVGSFCGIVYLLFRNDDDSDGKVARNIMRPLKTVLLSVGIPMVLIAIATPPKELAYTFVAVKAGEEVAETDFAKELSSEVGEIYELAKKHLKQQTQEAESDE